MVVSCECGFRDKTTVVVVVLCFCAEGTLRVLLKLVFSCTTRIASKEFEVCLIWAKNSAPQCPNSVETMVIADGGHTKPAHTNPFPYPEKMPPNGKRDAHVPLATRIPPYSLMTEDQRLAVNLYPQGMR